MLPSSSIVVAMWFSANKFVKYVVNAGHRYFWTLGGFSRRVDDCGDGAASFVANTKKLIRVQVENIKR
jgi:hypothetical protein